jgi:hypothetical protein
MKHIIITNEKNTVTVEKESGDFYVVHLGNKDMGLEMSKEEILSLQIQLAEILEN